MTKHLLVLPDGREISSGAGMVNAIANITVTEIVNSDTELTMGSVCSAIMEATIITLGTDFNISAGAEVALYEVNDLGARSKVGLFTTEKPTRSSAHRYKITAYDRVSWLDKDLSKWLSDLSGWPYDIYTLAGMVCEACGLTLATQAIPNGDFLVQHCPSVSGRITGRQLLKWVAEISGRFVTASKDGEIVFGWYENTGVTIAPSGGNYYFSGSLSYEDYQVEQVDAVKLRLSDSGTGTLWPAGEAENPYIISGNRLITNITAAPENVLDVMLSTIRTVQYVPCKVSVPASYGIHAGDMITVVDKNGVSFSTCVMKATRDGQKTALESTGSARRNSSENMNCLSNQDWKNYADSAASGAVQAQTQEDIYNKLTNGGEDQGVYLLNGKLYINASYIKTGEFLADLIKAGVIKSKDGTGVVIDLDKGTASLNGSVTTESEKAKSALSAGRLSMYYDNGLRGFLSSTSWNGAPGMAIYNTNQSKIFAFYGQNPDDPNYYLLYALNLGANPSDHTERHIFYDTVRFRSVANHSSNVVLENGVSLRGCENDGTVRSIAFINADNNLLFGNNTSPVFLLGDEVTIYGNKNVTINNLKAPVGNKDATNKEYVDTGLAGRAPAGYGYGDPMVWLGFDVSTWQATATFQADLEAAFAKVPQGGCMQVQFVDTNLNTQKHTGTIWKYTSAYGFLTATNYSGVMAVKTYYNSVWGEWEWLNPALSAGVEYRTTERIGNKAVYKKMDSAGKLWYRLDGSTTWDLYTKALGAASAGYGYGEAMKLYNVQDGTFEATLNSLLESLPVYGSMRIMLIDKTGLSSLPYEGTLWKYTNDYAALYAMSYAGTKSVKYKQGGTWSGWEFQNPGTVAGTENPTMERYNHKTVYTKLVDFGALPNATSKNVAHGLGTDATPISFEVFTSNGSVFQQFPFMSTSGTNVGKAHLTAYSVVITTHSDLTAYTDTKVLIKYIKN